MAGAVSRWLGAVEALPEIAQRLLRVQIENDSAISVIRRYDSRETLFYCDPPYPHESRGDSKAYRHEMTDEEHIELAQVLHNVKGKMALSGYHCDLLDELYGNWYVHEANSKKTHSVKTYRQEILWTNYKLPVIGSRLLESGPEYRPGPAVGSAGGVVVASQSLTGDKL